MVAKKAVKKKSVGTPTSKSALKRGSASKSGKTQSKSRNSGASAKASAKSGPPTKTNGKSNNAILSQKSQIGSAKANKGQHFPAPWDLKGEGFLFPLWAKKDYNREMGFFSDEDSKQYKGGLGSLMLVNYETSDVGPYYELLYIPGNFEYKDESYKRITRIFVSSQKSVEEGILNWAIPKERADFVWMKEGNLTKISAYRNGKEFFRVTIATKGFSFPVSTKILPYTLLQKSPEGYLQTRFVGKGKGRIATIQEIWSDEAVFPDAIKGGMFKTGIHANPFELVFPVAGKVD